MKKLAYLCFAILVMGCAHTSEEKSLANSDLAENESTEAMTTNSIEEAFPYATITEQKLQEYFDLVALKNKHPEFAETIALQLKQLAKDSIVFVKEQNSVNVNNLSALGEQISMNDTLQQRKFVYTITSKTMFKTDTLIVHIITKPTVMDGIETVSTKVIFSKN